MRKLVVVVAAVAMLAMPGAALGDQEPFGQHVSQCAQMALPPADPPTIVCEHHGEVHTFANFGEMVLFHLQEHHG